MAGGVAALVRQPVKPLPESVARVAALMQPFEPPWSLCGGWAVDAWVGRQTRDHNDVDVAVFRDDERAIFDHLADWHMSAHDTPDAAHSDRWDGHPLDFPAHIHARLEDGLEWEVQLNERSGGDWIVNRQPRIAIPVGRFSLRSPHGLPAMAQTFDNKNVGTGKALAVTTHTVDDGNAGENYAVILQTASGSISKRSVTFRANDRAKYYGDVVTFSGSEFDVAAGSLAPADAATLTLTSPGAVASAPTSAYAITASSATFTSGPASNYTVYYQFGTLTVNPRPAEVAYIGQTVFWASKSGKSTSGTLSASIQQDPGSGGPLANATVTFTDLLSGRCWRAESRSARWPTRVRRLARPTRSSP